MDSEKINENGPQRRKKNHATEFLAHLHIGHTVTFQGPCDRSTYTPMLQQYLDFFDVSIMLVIIGIRGK